MSEKREKPRSEQIGRRNRSQARSLLGRILVSGHSVAVVRAKPRIEKLRAHLALVCDASAADERSDFRDLGFQASR